MQITKQMNNGQLTLILSGELTLFNLNVVRQELISALNDGNKVAIDLKDVNECDTAGIQLVISAKKTSIAENREVTIVNPHASVLSAAERIGVDFQ